MGNYAPQVNSRQNVRESVADAPVFHAPQYQVGDALEELATGYGDILETVGRQAKASEASQKESLEKQELNEFSRRMLRLDAKRAQTGNRTAYELGARQLQDEFLARGIVNANTLATARNNYDEGYLTMEENSRERVRKANDEAEIKAVDELRTRYPSLKAKSYSEILRQQHIINNNYDHAIEAVNQLSRIDRKKTPELYERVNNEMKGYWSNNIVGQVSMSLADDLQSNAGFFKDPVQVEQYKQKHIENLVRNGVNRTDAILTVDHAFKAVGAYDVYGDQTALMDLSKKDLQLRSEYISSHVADAMRESHPELYVNAALRKELGDEAFAAYMVSAEGLPYRKGLAEAWEKSRKTGTIEAYALTGNKEKALEIASKLLKDPDINDGLKATSVASLLKGIDANFNVLSATPESRATVVSNSRGVNAMLGGSVSKAVIDKMKASPDVTTKALAADWEQAQKRKDLLPNVTAFVESPTEAGQALKFLNTSMVADNIRVAPNGDLVYVPDQVALVNAFEGGANKFMDYSGKLDLVNKEVGKQTGFNGKDRVEFWRAGGVPMLSEKERAVSPSMFANTRIQSTAKLEKSYNYTQGQEYLADLAKAKGFDDTLFQAVMKHESGGNQSSVSSAGAIGAMQIMPKTWKEEIAPALGFEDKDIKDMKKNVLGGTWYMARMLKQANGDLDKALAYYNWGQGNVNKAVDKYGEEWLQHAPAETQNYVNKVLADIYRGQQLTSKMSGKETLSNAKIASNQDVYEFAGDTRESDSVTGMLEAGRNQEAAVMKAIQPLIEEARNAKDNAGIVEALKKGQEIAKDYPGFEEMISDEISPHTDKEKDLQPWDIGRLAAEQNERNMREPHRGIVVKPTLDETKRTVVHNSDGTISTDRTISIEEDGLQVLIPTVVDGKVVSNDEAISHYEVTGEHYGKYYTIQDANEAAEALHNRQDKRYSK